MSTKPDELSPFWPSRIKHDRTWYSQYVDIKNRFYSPRTGDVYTISTTSNGGDVFTFSSCARTELSEQQSPESTTTSPQTPDWLPDNICSLAGAIEAGDLIYLGDDEIKTIGAETFFTTGSLTVKLPSLDIDPNKLRSKVHRPHSPTISHIASLTNFSGDSDDDTITIYTPPEQPIGSDSHTTTGNNPQQPTPPQTTAQTSLSTTDAEHPSSSQPQSPIQEYAQDVQTQFVPVSPFSKWTFESPAIREWVEGHFSEGETILSACAGKVQLDPPQSGTIIRNDLNPDRPNTDYNVDVSVLAAQDTLEKHSIDRIIFDPPWSVYQVTLRYDDYGSNIVSNDNSGEINLDDLPFETPNSNEKTQIGHARLAKLGFDYLLKPGGEVVEITLHGTSMFPEYQRVERVLFDPVGEGKSVIGSRDRKIQQPLTQFF